MKLEEIQSTMKADMLIASINKLIEKGITIHLLTYDSSNREMRGTMVALKRNREMEFYELREDGKLERHTSTSWITDQEIEDATLKKNDDGTYLFTVPNEEADEHAGPRRRRNKK